MPTRPARQIRRATRHHRCARCGHTAVYENAGATQARYWFSKHSCRKVEEKTLRRALAEERNTKVDHTPKPCHHKRANHQHGTRATYVLDKCRCIPCTLANRQATNDLNRQKAYGRYNKYVDATPVRAHVRTLMDAGLGLKQIVKTSGVAQGSLWKLMYGKRQPDGTQQPSRRVLRSTAERLYALDPTWGAPLPLADGRILSPEASAIVHRKMQALVALGWSMSELGRRMGITHVRNFIDTVKGERAVTVATAKKADALYAQLSMTLPTPITHHEKVAVTKARNYAKAHGWVPPLALDDEDWQVADTSPDHDTSIDEAAVWRRLNGDRAVELSLLERQEVVRRLHSRGMSNRTIRDHTGIPVNNILYDLKHLGLTPNPREDAAPVPAPGGRRRRPEQREVS